MLLWQTDSYLPIPHCLCHCHAGTHMDVKFSNSLTNFQQTLRTHSLRFHQQSITPARLLTATLQRSWIRDVTIESGVFRDAVPRFQRRGSYLHSVISRYTRNELSFTLISTTFFAPIFTTSKLLNSIICLCVKPNFTQIELYIWRVRIAINLHPQAKYEFHSADFHDTQVAQ